MSTVHVRCSFRVHQKRNNKTVETQDFGENEDKNHADEQSWLLGCSSDACVANNANGKAGCETGKTDRQAGTELYEACEEGSLLLEVVGDQDGDDEPVDTDDTSHDNGDDIWKGQ